MNKKNPKNRKTWLILLLIAAGLAVAGISASQQGEAEKSSSLADVIREPVGVMIGSTYVQIARDNGYITEETEIETFNSEVDAVQALRDRKIGSYINCDIYSQPFIDEFEELMVFPQPVGLMEYAFGFQEGSPLRDAFNAAMKTMKEDGSEQALYDKWLSGNAGEQRCIPQDWAGENGTLNYWLNVGTPPMAFLSEGGNFEGLSIDYVLTACRIMGYNVEIKECSFSGLIPALQSQKADIAGRSIAITEERDKSIDFSEPFVTANIVLLVRKDTVSDAILSQAESGSTAQKGFVESIAESFRSTFLEEGRWEVFLQGIGVTLLITVLSAILGTLFGLFWYLLSAQNIRWVSMLIRAFNRWLSGIPAVVVLMIMYYLIFTGSAMNATVVAVISFTILFGIGVFGLLETGVEAVGKGQVESAIDLGFTQNQIFLEILLPQTVLYIMPLYRAKIVEHLKATAIVGYIAIMDLTKVCDLIRSRTFEAFFPLIITAILYYSLGRLLNFLLTTLESRLRPGNTRSRLLRGVNVHD